MGLFHQTTPYLTIIPLIAALGPLSTAGANELSKSDKLKVLYSNQFTFDRQGVPLITVGVAEGQRRVTLESTAPIRVLPDGEDGSEVRAGNRWQITLKRGKKAQIEHFIILEQKPITKLRSLQRAMQTWQGRGARCQLIEMGNVFGIKGNVFDNRAYALVSGPYKRRDQALRVAATYVHKYGVKKRATLPRLKRRPSGLLEARDLTTAVRVRVRDVIWFSPAKGARLTVKLDKAPPRSYWGQIYITLDRRGTLAVVNAVPGENLLAGLVPAEIFPTAPAGALKAQAIAARGELLAKIGIKHIADPYFLCSTQHCQVYAGAGHEHPRTTAAVKATKGMVLQKKANGRLVDTVYSASCGGHTEHNDQAWPTKPDPSLRGRLDGSGRDPAFAPFRRGINDANIERWLSSRPPAWCTRSRYNKDKYRWTAKISATRINKMVKSLGVGPVKRIRVVARGISGRATLVEIIGARARKEVRGELKIRRLFGGLRSSMFTVRGLPAGGSPAEFVFRGGGWGHGVGMCQTGAIGMSKAGKTFREILYHYYSGSEVKALY